MKPKALATQVPAVPEGLDPKLTAFLQNLVASIVSLMRQQDGYDPITCHNGNVHIGFDVLPTNVTKGFLYIPRCAGAPTGVPKKYGGCPIVYDSTNNKIYVYNISSSLWKSVALA